MAEVKNLKRIFQRVASAQSKLLFLLFWSLPFVLVNDSVANTRVARLLYLFLICSWIIASDRLRGQFLHNFNSLNRNIRLLFWAIVLSAVLSTLLSDVPTGVRLIGFNPEFLGLATWAAFAVIGITLAHSFQKIVLSKIVLAFTSAILFIGLVYNKFYIYYGIRVNGLLLQSTTMSMYAVMCLAIGLYGLNSKDKIHRLLSTLCIVLSTLTVIFTQSRVGYVAFVIVLFMWGLNRMKSWPAVALIAIIAMLTLSSLPHVFGNYFIRLRSSQVERGISYRVDMYRLSATDVLKKKLFVGDGPGVLPAAINDKDLVPEEIARTLEEDNLFVSTHDLYLDFAYVFGGLASLGLIVVSVYAVVINLMKRANGFLLVLFTVMILNALLNVPSLELTSMYFVALFALLLPQRPTGLQTNKS